VALAACVEAVLALRLWRADMRVPLNCRGDSVFFAMMVKAVIDHGWYLTNPQLGAPVVLALHDFPQANGIHLVLVKLLSCFSTDWALRAFRPCHGFHLRIHLAGVHRNRSIQVTPTATDKNGFGETIILRGPPMVSKLVGYRQRLACAYDYVGAFRRSIERYITVGQTRSAFNDGRVVN
jgi:hypothetical protein